MVVQTPYNGPDTWPADFQGCILTGHFTYLDGTPVAAGKLTLTATPNLLISTGADFIISGKTLPITLDTSGRIRGPLGTTGIDGLMVPATDDPDINPTSWVYRVRQLWDGVSYNIIAPQNTQKDITEVIDLNSFNAAAPASVVITQGPQGIPGPQGPPGTPGSGGGTALTFTTDPDGSPVMVY